MLTTEQLRARAAHLRAKAEQWRGQGYAGKAARLDGDADALNELAANRESHSAPVACIATGNLAAVKNGVSTVIWPAEKNQYPMKLVDLYTAPPAPAVPDAITSANAPEVFEMAAIVERLGLRGAYGAYAAGYNACRAAMLQSAPGAQTAAAPDLSSINSEITPGRSPAAWEGGQ
ncbi:Uncharacterised protein [Serratia ficaria]|nr:Uncharacterised protein [Serratia ficaria]